MSDGGGGRGITMVALHRDVGQPSRWSMTSCIGTTLRVNMKNIHANQREEGKQIICTGEWLKERKEKVRII